MKSATATPMLWMLFVLASLAGCSEPGQIAGAPAASPAGTDPEQVRLEAIAQRVTIIRDDFGVPHIYGKTDADAVFGLLYAQAEDDFPRIERNYIWAVGRLAEVQGEQALYSDLRARLYMSRQEAEAAYAIAPAWLQRLCDAFADGLNYYLFTHPEVAPELLTRFEPWMPFYFFEGSIGGDIEQIPLDGIEAFYSQGRAVEDQLPVAGARIAAAATGIIRPLSSATISPYRGRFEEPAGSNGIAIAGERTRSGNAMLLINPHTSFFFRGEVHVVSEEGLNAYGAVTWGQFFIYQGFNEHTGWMHTTTYADFMDQFVQQVVREDGALKAKYGDELRPLTVSEVSLKVREKGTVRERHFRIYRTPQGPVTHTRDGHWVTTRINWDPVNALRQSYLRMKNANYEQFRGMMDIRTNSSNNTVYADSSGNIAYFHGNFMPKRNPAVDYSRPVDGSDPATDWTGLHSIEETVHLLNPASGWIQNTNSTPFTAAGPDSPKRSNYPRYMAPDPENFRGLHAVQVLTDAKDLTLDQLIELAYDPYLPGFEKLLTGLIAAWQEQANTRLAVRPGLAAAVDSLRDWDLKVRLDSTAMTLAHFYGVNMIETIEVPSGLSGMEAVEWLGTESDPAARLRIFARTLDELEADFGTWSVPWGEVNRYQRLDGAIDARFDDAAGSLAVPMASGNWGALASFGAPRREDVRRLYGRSGNSFVAVVEFGQRLRAKSLLAGGQSSDPESVHFDDQAQRYADRQFKDVAFYPDEVEGRAIRRYHPGEPAPATDTAAR